MHSVRVSGLDLLGASNLTCLVPVFTCLVSLLDTSRHAYTSTSHVGLRNS